MKPLPFFVGSLPFQSSEEAIRFVGEYSSHLPFLPQLPEANPQEDMLAQTLRGIELGYWDEAASVCLEEFQNEFVESPRVKFQIAGPATLSRAISTSFDAFVPQWMRFWKGFARQLQQAGFQQEIWLQIDEPFWGEGQALPEKYEKFLEEVRSVRTSLKVGLHSCQEKRPKPHETLLQKLSFLSLNFSTSLPDTAEAGRLQMTEMIWGVIERGQEHLPPGLTPLLSQSPWVSALCGLWDWSPEEIHLAFQKFKPA